jgi:hypothetical protein
MRCGDKVGVEGLLYVVSSSPNRALLQGACMQWSGRHLRALRAVSLPSWICQRLYKRFNTSHTFGSVRFLYAGTTDTHTHINEQPREKVRPRM